MIDRRHYIGFAVALAIGLVAACGDDSGVSIINNIPDDASVIDDKADPIFDKDSGTTGPCKPRACADIGANCGPIGDGCGGIAQCGTCSAPDICGGGGQAS